MVRRVVLALLVVAGSALGCEPRTPTEGSDRRDLPRSDGGGAASAAAATAGPVPGVDAELAACRARWEAIEATAAEPGVPELDARRAAILGRARGPALLFARAPTPTSRDALPEAARTALERLDRDPPGVRVSRAKAALKRDPRALRAALLREGYAFTTEPLDAFELVERVTLVDLFDEPRLVLERGASREVLVRARHGKEHRYQRASDGRPAQLLFGDRITVADEPAAAAPGAAPPGAAAPDAAAPDAASPPAVAAPAPPLHVDVGAFADAAGFDRLTPRRLTASALLAELRVAPAGRTVRAVLDRRGAALELGCLVEPRDVRDEVVAAIEADAWRRRATAAMRAAVEEAVHDALPFDRPREVEGPDRDGELRPHWASAYLSRRQAFSVDDVTYPVFTPDGRPLPPQVCVDFVLDAWERASGRWYRPRGESPGRTAGRLDLDAEAIPNRRGVLGFGDFASSRPDLFDVRRFQGIERVPFAERDRFFAGLTAAPPTDREPFRAGDVVAIHGLKRDGRVHQHAILVEGVDPVTGLPHALADQMKRPRRRTWEGIMAEAPKRSLLYRARPREALFRKLDPG